MGRPPIGKVAMTAAERMRRYRARRQSFRNAAPVTKPAQREADTAIDSATLPISSRQKLEAAIRQEKRRLQAQYEQDVRAEVRKRIDEMVLPHWHERLAEANAVMKARKPFMDLATWTLILRCLHPDNSASDKMRNEAFIFWNDKKLKKVLVKEPEPQQKPGDLPRTLAEFEKRRRKK